MNRNRSRFSIRTALTVTAITALAFGWYVSVQRVKQRSEKEIASLAKRLSYQEWKSDWGKDHLAAQVNAKSRDGSKGNAANKGVFSSAVFNRVNMQGISVAGMFQGVTFDHCILQDATLNGGSASFQGANFDGCNLVNAKLIGSDGSFQMSSFVNADLTNAVLTGGASSFQGSAFQGAKLIGAIVLCPDVTSFQLVNIDRAQFQGADLSSVDCVALESCTFDAPPHYDGNTQFPVGFDPSKQLWILKP